MQSITDKLLIWWRDVPIDVETGLLIYLSDNWNNDIFVICANDYEEGRKKCAWEIGGFRNVHMIIGNLESDLNYPIIDRLLTADAVHIFSGIKGGHRRYLDKLKRNPSGSCVVVMESPSLYGSVIQKAIKRLLYPVIYSGYQKKYKNVVKGLFTMGEDAVHLYDSYGWKNIFDFMYLPRIRKMDGQRTVLRKKIKMLYIGRFDFAAKGVDVLMRAIRDLETDVLWELHLVGGYGTNKDQIIEWCNTTKNVEFAGSWTSDQMIENMTEYDFCIVPSNYDGWNLTPLQAIYAGIGCIISDNAGSQELIRNSRAGAVVKAGDARELSTVIKNVIENHGIIDMWKDCARNYADRISIEQVGGYFIQSLRYCFGEIERKPECPW